MKIKFTLKILLISLFFFQISAQECYNTTYSGEGTFYGGIAGSTGGNCSLPVELGDYFHCAMNNIEYDNSNACGACITVTGPNGSITLQVVDRCPECVSGDIDMTEDAFRQIADFNDGRVPITWQYTICEDNIDNDIKVVFKSGSSEFWTGIQFRNTTHAVVSMEYQSGDNWVSVERELYNYFVDASGIPSPMNLRVTSVLGEQIIFEDVDIVNSVEISTNKQFSTPDDCEVYTPTDGETSTDSETPSDDETSELFLYSFLTTDNIHITSITIDSEVFNKDDISLFNMLGQKINIETTYIDTHNIKINTQNLAHSIYILKIQEEDGNILTEKIIIE